VRVLELRASGVEAVGRREKNQLLGPLAVGSSLRRVTTARSRVRYRPLGRPPFVMARTRYGGAWSGGSAVVGRALDALSLRRAGISPHWKKPTFSTPRKTGTAAV